MRKTITAFVSVLAVLLLASAPAAADLAFVEFDFTLLDLHYSGDAGGRVLTISDSDSAQASVTLKDGMGIVDGPATISLGNFDLQLQATVGTAAQGYAVTGTFWATDVDTGSRAFDGTFTSTLVDVISAYQGTLIIEGKLAGVGTQSILVNRPVGTDDWVYAGTVGTVTVANANPYDTGQLLQMTFGVDGSTLADLFDNGEQSGGAGWMHGTVVPVPAAVVLGVIGLGLVGFRMRKYA